MRFVFSMMASQLALLSHSACSSILPIHFCSPGALEEYIIHSTFGQPLDATVGRSEVLPDGVVDDGSIHLASDTIEAGGGSSVFADDTRGSTFTVPGEMFNWPDGDIILRTTHGSEIRDFRVHKPFISFASPVFKGMLMTSKSPSSPSNIITINLGDPPLALELILRFIYPTPVPPVVDDLTVVSEALHLANKYDIEVARSRLRSSLVEFAKTEPLRVYAIACRLGYEDEMKIASKHTLSINLPALTQLPDEFKLISATEYHRLISLHMRYRNEAVAITTSSLPNVFEIITRLFDALIRALAGKGDRGAGVVAATMKKSIVDIIRRGTPLDYGSVTLALKTDYGIGVGPKSVGNVIRSVLDKIGGLNMTV